jgi:hypothetical protein
VSSMILWIEGAVALAFVLAFVIHALVAFKPGQIEHGPARVRIGAAIQGLVLGLLIGFVMVPLRMQLMAGDAPAPGMSSLSYLPALAMLIVIRRGALLRAPVISPYLRAYRRAGLLRARDEASKALGKLDELEARGVLA